MHDFELEKEKSFGSYDFSKILNIDINKLIHICSYKSVNGNIYPHFIRHTFYYNDYKLFICENLSEPIMTIKIRIIKNNDEYFDILDMEIFNSNYQELKKYLSTIKSSIKLYTGSTKKFLSIRRKEKIKKLLDNE